MSRTNHHGKHGSRWLFKMPRPYGSTPGWWVALFMNRPRRRRDRRLLERVVKGLVDADEAAFSVGGRRPHVYYW